jgi:hypothetical protein
MKRSTYASVATIAIASLFTFSAPAGARTLWICDVPGEGLVTFVSAADAARHGIDTANSRAGTVFHAQFGETCHVESS